MFNRSAHFGASPIYDPDQAEYLLVNMKIGEIDIWSTDGPPVVAAGTPDFIDWYGQAYPSRDPLTGEEYLARAGRRALPRGGASKPSSIRLPAGLSVSCHVGEVVDIERVRGRCVIAVDSGDGREAVCVDKVMLATGHSCATGARGTKLGRIRGTPSSRAVHPVRVPRAGAVGSHRGGDTRRDARPGLHLHRCGA